MKRGRKGTKDSHLLAVVLSCIAAPHEALHCTQLGVTQDDGDARVRGDLAVVYGYRVSVSDGSHELLW